jgi:hypothetical protein
MLCDTQEFDINRTGKITGKMIAAATAYGYVLKDKTNGIKSGKIWSP